MHKAAGSLFHVSKRVESISFVHTILRENLPEKYASSKQLTIHATANIEAVFNGTDSFLFVRLSDGTLGIVSQNNTYVIES